MSVAVDRERLVDWASRAISIPSFTGSEEEMASRFNTELTRAIRPFPNRREVAHHFLEMHKRHGEATMTVLATCWRTSRRTIS